MEIAGSPMEVDSLSFGERLNIVNTQVQIHQHGIIHNDIRLDNILICHHNNMDFKSALSTLGGQRGLAMSLNIRGDGQADKRPGVPCMGEVQQLTVAVIKCEFRSDTREDSAESVGPLGLERIHILEHQRVGLIQDLKHSFKLTRLQDIKLSDPPLQSKSLSTSLLDYRQYSVPSPCNRAPSRARPTGSCPPFSRPSRLWICLDGSLVETGNDGRSLGCVELEVFNIFRLGPAADTHVRALDQLFALTKLRRLLIGTLFVPSSMAQD
ncbi:hypothetical protein BGZ83_000112 [Gryganskiella cystojenkinii]|nr:hypothetical protein BGZ83_000112 [Gryganskiella cystojenkinii]